MLTTNGFVSSYFSKPFFAMFLNGFGLHGKVFNINKVTEPF